MRVEYVAFDGTVFSTKIACEEYEEVKKKSITHSFIKNCVKSVHEGVDITNDGSAFVEASIGEGDYYAIVRFNNEEELKIAQEYQRMTKKFYYTDDGYTDERVREFERKDIGRDLIVYIGNLDYGDNLICWDYCCIHGTLDEVIDEYRNAMLKMFQATNEKDVNRIKF
jgi:hypothetical protein